MSSTTPFSLLGEPPVGPSGTKDKRDTRARLYELAEWICDPELLIRRTDSIEFTDLTTIAHRTRLEFPDGKWPYPVPHSPDLASGADDPPDPLGLIFLGFMRRGMPLQHSKVTMFEGGERFELTRLKASDTEHLAILLLDAVWLSCSVNELNGIPRPLEGESREPLTGRDDRYNISPFWQEFLGMRGRNVNPDWDLLKTRFELSESGWANEIWRPPSANEPKWSYERALLAKLCSKLAFSYIAAAWVPANALADTDGPFEIEVEFQERVLRPREQVERVRALRRRSKKAFERSLLQLDERESESKDAGRHSERADLAPESLDTDLWRLDNVPETYLGLLDPALDDPDDGKRSSWKFDRREPIDKAKSERKSSWLGRLSPFALSVLVVGLVGGVFPGLKPPFSGVVSTLLWAGVTVILGFAFLGFFRHLRVIAAWSRRNRWQIGVALFSFFLVVTYLGLIWPPPTSLGLDYVVPYLDIPLVPLVLLGGYALARVTRFLRWARRETMVLPTWAAGPTSIVYEVSCPPEFTVWQGILARPSRRGRCWRTRPASELGRRAHLWWSEPSDRGWMEGPPEDRPQLLVLELRARLSSSITLVGAFLALATAILLAGPAFILLHNPFTDLPLRLDDLGNAIALKDEGENSFLLSADFIATVLLLLPTVGGAILVRPGEDPIARKLLTWDRLLIAVSTVVPAVVTVSLLLVFGLWWTPAAGDDVFLWTIWFWLGLFSLVSSAILFLAWTQTRGSDTPAPSARQGGFPPYPNPRRRPLDVPAPLKPLATMKGRINAERNLLRLAPNRSRRTPRPNYSLVLPAEGSRVYTPPAPTILCLIEAPNGSQADQGDRSDYEDPFEVFVSKGLGRLSESGFTRGIRNTNTIGWQPGVFSGVPNPLSDRPYGEDLQTQILLHLFRLQKANARPSRSKPVGNGGGLVPLPVPALPADSGKSLATVLCEKFDEANIFEADGQGKRDNLVDYDDWRRRKISAMVGRRALVDIDGVILISRAVVDEFMKQTEPDGGLSRFELKSEKKLERGLSRFAGKEARKAGTGPGAHVWPSSFEPPLAGESWGWSGLGSPPSFFSLRPLFFKHRKSSSDDASVLSRMWYRLLSATQGIFFDQGLREIPVTRMEATKVTKAKQMTYSKFLLSIPRVFGGVETEDRNQRVQNILWFGQSEVTQGGTYRACPVKLRMGTSCSNEKADCVRTVTDVVGHRVWVWNDEIGMDHRNFEFRKPRESDFRLQLGSDATGGDDGVSVATPSWRLGQEPSESKRGDWVAPAFGLTSFSETGSGEAAGRRREIVGKFVDSHDVICAEGSIRSELGARPPGPTVISWLHPLQSERLAKRLGTKFVPVQVRMPQGTSAVDAEIERLSGSQPPIEAGQYSVRGQIRKLKEAGYSGLVILEQDPWPWRGGVQVPPPRDEQVKPILILVGGIVASGKSELAQRLRTRLERDDEFGAKRWEVIRNDSNHNLFFQIHDFDQDESMDEQEGLNFARDHEDPLSRRLTELVQRTYLLESMSEFDRAHSHSWGYSGGLIVEYWPSFSVRAMAQVQKGRSLSDVAYSRLDEDLKFWETTSKGWPDPKSTQANRPLALRIDSEVSICVLRAVKRSRTRHGEKVGARYLDRLDEVVEMAIPRRSIKSVFLQGSGMTLDGETAVPDGSRVVIVNDDKTDYFATEVERVARLINKMSQ